MPTIQELEARRGTGFDENYTFDLRRDAFYPEVFSATSNFENVNTDFLNDLIRARAMDFQVIVHNNMIHAFLGFKNKEDANLSKEAILAHDPLAKVIWYENRILMDDEMDTLLKRV